MCKLISAPRVPKELSVPKKPRIKKKKTISEDTKVTYKVLREGSSSTVNQLFELYKLDRYKARVKYMSNPRGYSYTRLVIFEYGDKEFEITEFENTFGVSKTNRIYSSQKKVCSIIFKKGKFYYINKRNKNNMVRPLTFHLLNGFIYASENCYDRKIENSEIFNFLISKAPWIKTVFETEAAYALSFNTILTNKLTSQKDLLRHVFKVPMNVIQVIDKSVQAIYVGQDDRPMIRQTNRPRSSLEILKQWKEVSKVLDGVQNLTEEFYHHPSFYDTCTMAYKLGKKVNCRWGIKKLVQMHDEWSKDLRNILLDCEIEYMLKVRLPYYGLASYSGWKLLFTNKELLVEGVRQNHCVGGYIDRVERGECAIFHVDGYTLQVRIDRCAEVVGSYTTTATLTANNLDNIDRVLLNNVTSQNLGNVKPILRFNISNVQFRGKNNCDPPNELVEKVNQMLDEYGRSKEFQDLVNGRGNSLKIDEMCNKIYKTKWEVVINHETHSYEVKEGTGLNGLAIKKPSLFQFSTNDIEVTNAELFDVYQEDLPF